MLFSSLLPRKKEAKKAMKGLCSVKMDAFCPLFPEKVVGYGMKPHPF
jgi:hypothetical protein